MKIGCIAGIAVAAALACWSAIEGEWFTTATSLVQVASFAMNFATLRLQERAR